MEDAKIKTLKQTFPELRNLEGRFFRLFLKDLQEKIEDWAIWARLELQGKKCYNTYRDAICKNCAHFSAGGCAKYPKLGQIWEGAERADLRHPNTDEWYWCIKECPDFIEKENGEQRL